MLEDVTGHNEYHQKQDVTGLFWLSARQGLLCGVDQGCRSTAVPENRELLQKVSA